MFLFDLFRSFLPLRNPIGFGASDFLEFAIAAILIALVLGWTRIVVLADAVARRPRACMAGLAALPILLRLALLVHYPVPTPSGSDDFSYLLLADTLKHFRLANPVHPMHEFFESIFVLQEPSYSSIFPLGQGFVLTLGWAGVLLSGGAFCALCFWMLRGWTSTRWALLGGLLAVAEFGPLCQWMNDYWGGFVSACAGCLVFGAIPRLRDRPSVRDAVLLGAGIGIQWLTRPFECVLLVLAAALFLKPRKFLVPALIPIVLAGGLTLLQNHAVTKSWTKMPYMLSREQYGVPAGFSFEPNPVPHRALTQEQQLDYQAQSAAHDRAGYWERFSERLSFYRFFLMVPLFVAPLAFWRYPRVALTIFVFAIGTNFYPYFYPHYIAAEACLFVLIGVASLQMLKKEFSQLLLLICATHVIFWYGIHLAGAENLRVALMRYENWDFINYGDPEGRIAINRKLEAQPGKQLVFVRYSAQHGFHEWIRNAAEIDNAQIVWAGDLGVERNELLKNYYKDRQAWLIEPDARPPRLTLLPASAAATGDR